MPRGLPEWPIPESYAEWQLWAHEIISRLNDWLLDDYDEVGMIANFAVALPQNGRWIPANGTMFLADSYPELAQKLGTTFGAGLPGPPVQIQLPTVTAPANFVAGIRAI